VAMKRFLVGGFVGVGWGVWEMTRKPGSASHAVGEIRHGEKRRKDPARGRNGTSHSLSKNKLKRNRKRSEGGCKGGGRARLIRKRRNTRKTRASQRGRQRPKGWNGGGVWEAGWRGVCRAWQWLGAGGERGKSGKKGAGTAGGEYAERGHKPMATLEKEKSSRRPPKTRGGGGRGRVVLWLGGGVGGERGAGEGVGGV